MEMVSGSGKTSKEEKMNHERKVYWNVDNEVWEGIQVKLKDGWWRRPETEKLIKVCEDKKQAEEYVKKLAS